MLWSEIKPTGENLNLWPRYLTWDHSRLSGEISPQNRDLPIAVFPKINYTLLESEPQHDWVVGFTRGPQGPFTFRTSQFHEGPLLQLLCTILAAIYQNSFSQIFF